MPELRYIGGECGQLDSDSQEYPMVVFPCALVSVSDIEYDESTKDRCKGNVSLIVRVANDAHHVANAKAPVGHQDNALLILDLVEKVRDSCDGHKCDGFKPLSVTRISNQPRLDGIQDYSVYIKTVFYLRE